MRSAPPAPQTRLTLFESEWPALRELMWSAGRTAVTLALSPLQTRRKEDRSLVTNADQAINTQLRADLRRRFPTHALLSEETGLEGPGGAEFCWCIDPLDGTRAYAKKVPGYSVMVGLLREGRPVLGWVMDPVTGRLYEGFSGVGAAVWEGGVRRVCRVSPSRSWTESPVITSTGFPDGLADLMRGHWSCPFLPPINSVGIKVGFLVRGEADLYVNHHPVHLWDTAGPLAILEAAGGRMTHWDGSALTYDLAGDHRHAGPTIATSGSRHEEWVAWANATPAFRP